MPAIVSVIVFATIPLLLTLILIFLILRTAKDDTSNKSELSVEFLRLFKLHFRHENKSDKKQR